MTRRLLFLVFITLTILICKINSHDHSHDHGHAHGHVHGHGHAHEHGHGHGHAHAHEEPPSFKYSREANEGHHGHAHSHGEESVTYAPPHYNEGSDDDDDDDDDEKVAPFSVLSWALLSTLGISLAPVIILFFIPVTNSPQHQWFLKILLSFASGGLLGDAFLHLIPHAMSSNGNNEDGHGHGHSHGHSHNHSADIHIGLNVLLGIFLFLIVEKFVRHMKGSGHSHGHTHEVTAKHSSTEDDDDDNKKNKSPKKPKKQPKPTTDVVPKNEMKISGYLNLFADFLHNFTDGLAIGSTYLLGKKIGAITTMTIFFHEIPHEIGDYAILIQNGCSRKKAMLLQLTTAIGALLGCLVGLLFHSMGTQLWATQTFLPITAGGFIYIATVSVIPELLETNGGLKQSILEMLALIVGVVIMVLVAMYE